MAISALPPTPDMRLLTYMSLDLPLAFVTIVKMEQGDSQLLHGDITGKQIHWMRLRWRCSCLEPVFQIKISTQSSRYVNYVHVCASGVEIFTVSYSVQT